MFAILKDTVWVIISQVAGRGVLFLTGAALAWRMGRDTFAEFSYLALTSAALTTYFAMGAGTAVTRYVAAAGEAPAGRGGNIAAAGFIGLLGGCVAVLLIALLPALFLPDSVANLKLPLISALSAQLVGNLASSALTGAKQFRAVALANVSAGVALLLLAGLGMLSESHSLIIWAIPLSQLVFLLLALRATLPVLAGDFTGLRFTAVLALVPMAVRFSGPVFALSVFAATGPWALGLLLLKVSKLEFAAYSAGLQWFSLILVVPGALSSAYLPRLFRDSAAHLDGVRRSASLVRANALQSLAIAAATAAVALPLSGLLIRLHGEVLSHNKGVFVAFVLAAVTSAATIPLGNGMVAGNRQTTWLALTAVWLATLLAVARLAPVTTALAAGMDLCFGYALLLVLGLFFFRRPQRPQLP